MSRQALALATLLLLAGCASTGLTGRTLTPGASVTLVTGESVTLPDASELTYIGVRNDSRCRPGVYCIHAGSAALVFRHGSEGEVLLETDKTPSAPLGPWRLQLVGLDFSAPPKATIRLDPAP